MMLTDTTPLDAALGYAARGWRVVPIIPRDKHPSLNAWPDVATTDAALIREWWARWADHGVGIVTGARSNLWVLDVDIADDKRGDETLADLEAMYGPLPATAEVVTGSGGRHLYFLWPTDGADIPTDAGMRLGPGLDVRGSGGQVVAPPTVHPNGQPYAWEVSAPPDPVMGPGWLVELLTTVPDAAEARRERIPRIEGEERPGDRYSDRTTWVDILTADGATFIGARVERTTKTTYELWARPGVDHGSATLYYKGSDVLKLFTPNWGGKGWALENGATYTRFGYLAARHFGGDHSAAAAALARWETDEAIDAWIGELDRKAAAERSSDAAESPEPAPPPSLTIRWVDDLEGQMPPEPPEIVQGLLRAGEMMVLGAPRAIGKTWLGYNLACQLAAGEGEFLGSLPILRQARTLYLQGELDQWGSATRWKLLTGIDRPLPHVAETFDRLRIRVVQRRQEVVVDGKPALDTHPEAVVDERLEAAIVAHGVDLVIIDPWAVYFAGSENSNDEVEAALDKLRDITLRHGTAWVILHHISAKAVHGALAEPEDLWRGATRLADWASTRVTILPHYTDARRKELGLERREARRFADVHFLRRSTPTDDFSMELVDGWWRAWVDDEDGSAHGGRPPAVTATDLVEALAAAGGEWPSMAEAARSLGVSWEAAARAVGDAIKLGLVVKDGGNVIALASRVYLAETPLAVDLAETVSERSETIADLGKDTETGLAETPSSRKPFPRAVSAGQGIDEVLAETPPYYVGGPPLAGETLPTNGERTDSAPASGRESWMWTETPNPISAPPPAPVAEEGDPW